METPYRYYEELTNTAVCWTLSLEHVSCYLPNQ